MFDKLRDNGRLIVYIVVAIFVISGAFAGFGAYMSGGGNRSTSANSQNIATVNGENITQQEYISTVRNQAPQSQRSSNQILSFKYNILKQLIERKLVLQKADDMGIKAEVTNKEVQNTIDEILKQNEMTEDELKDNLSKQNFTLDAFKKDIRNSLKTQQKIQKTIDKSTENVEVTEAEIKEEYENQTKDKKDPESYEDLKEDIKNSLRNQKQSQAFNNWMTNLKDDAKIEIYDARFAGMKALENKEYDQAISNFNDALNNGSSPAIYLHLANAYRQKENNDKAIETFEKGLEEYSSNWELHYNLGDLYKNLEEEDKALAQFDKASENLGNQNIMGRYQVYLGYKDLGAEEKAKTEQEKIMEIQQQQMQPRPQNSNEQNTTTDEKAEDTKAESVFSQEENKETTNEEQN